VVEIPRSDDFGLAASATVDAKRQGAPAIYQGELRTGMWQGWSDFLERVDRPSALGDFSDEVVDTKLKQRPDRKCALQLADLLQSSRRGPPAACPLVIGTGERVPLPLNDVQF
jgi:uncharacterized protein